MTVSATLRSKILDDLAQPPAGALLRALRSRVLALLGRLSWTELVLVEDDRTQTVVTCARPRYRVRLTVHDPAFWGLVALNGSVGAGEAYIRGLWEVDDLVSLVRALAYNRDLTDALDGGLARFSRPLRELAHAARRNTRRGARANIASHYDLGNDFFETFLDPWMQYSSAVFERPDQGLDAAAEAKLRLICRKLDLGPEDHLLEIGTGWGGLAVYAARRCGCRVTSTTISEEQARYARERVRAAGLAGRVQVLTEDYRDLRGRYRKLVSVEMVEAVGHQYLEQYLRCCARLLERDGCFLMQAITIEDHRYTRARDSVDFIKRYVFPGSFIPSVSVLAGAAASASDLRLVHLEDIGDSYARTIAAWRARFEARLAEIRDRGYGEDLIRLWRFYLAYCEGGFLERAISDVQMLWVRPDGTRRPLARDLA